MQIEQIFEAVKKNTVELEFHTKETDAKKGASKFGGKPDLPEDFTWPYYCTDTFDDETVKLRPLSFLVQINCATVSKYDTEGLLPKQGMLYFFYELGSQKWGFDPKEKGCARVFYYDVPEEALKQTEFPRDLAENFILPEIPIQFKNRDDIPDWSEYAEDHETDLDWEMYNSQREKVIAFDDADKPITKLLGYADIIQGDMRLECEMSGRRRIYTGHGYPKMTDEEKVQLLEDAQEWTLLFQLDTVEKDDFELMFGDCGRIYFYIRKDDLRKRDFEHIWLILQCY